MKKYIWYLYAFFGSIIVYLSLGFYLDNLREKYYKEFHAKPLNGHIIHLASGGRGRSEFQLNTQKEKDGLYLERDHGIFDTEYNMYQFAEVGDSIAKDTNTAYLKLIKKNGEEIWFKMVEH